MACKFVGLYVIEFQWNTNQFKSYDEWTFNGEQNSHQIKYDFQCKFIEVYCVLFICMCYDFEASTEIVHSRNVGSG